MTVPDIAMMVAGVLVGLPVTALFLQIVASLMPRRSDGDAGTMRPRLAVLVPAHDEHAVIESTICTIAPQLAPGDRLVVVADNCSDDTAAVAGRAGAEVTERFDSERRGKGYALAHGLQYLEQTGAPDVVVFVDADCRVGPGTIDRLARAAQRWGRPIQGAYLMAPPAPPRPTASIVAFAWRVKDFVRPLGWSNLGLPCQLAGSGMAFPWHVVRAADLASGHLVEDVKQGLDLALAGHFPMFCPEASVTSRVFAGRAPSGSQRARWEHGMLQIMLDYVPRLFVRFLKAPSASLAAMALDILVPPLALLALLLGAYLLASLALAAAGGGAVPVFLALGLCTIFTASIVLAWWRHGWDVLPLGFLVFAPVYALAKIPLYVKFLVARQRAWVRGEREAH